MRITEVFTTSVFANWRNWLFVHVKTDDGVSGIGECTVEWNEKAVVGAVEHMKQHVLGEDPFNIERLWQRMFYGSFWMGGPILNSAISGIEQALWDIVGKTLKVPVYKLIGGAYRDSVPLYANGWFRDCKTPEDYARAALRVKEKEYRALKWDPFPAEHLQLTRSARRRVLDVVGAVREAIGDDMDIIIEVHGRLNYPSAQEIINKLAGFDPAFIEESIPPGNPSAMAQLARDVKIPLATGERLYTKWGFAELIEKQGVGLIQPDVCHCGGILELKKIAAMAESRHIMVSPHNPNGPVAFMASLHCGITLPNLYLLESVVEEIAYARELFTYLPKVVGGEVRLPEDRPGLGIDLNPEVAAQWPPRQTMGGEVPLGYIYW